MSTVAYGSLQCERGDGESVLDALLRAGAVIPHMCKAGSCGSCLLQATEGEIPEEAQRGLKDSWKAKGYFLACVSRPPGDVRVEMPGGEARHEAVIESVEALTSSVLRVRLRCSGGMDYRAGQHVSLMRQDGLARSYSIANPPEDGEIELHVRRIANGQMSGWLHREAAAGMPVTLLGPSGECFYVPGRPEQPLLLVGTGTGLAPLYGILRDALRQGHHGPIHLIHGALREEGLYLRRELQELAAVHENVTYTPTVMTAEDPVDMPVGPIEQVVAKQRPKLEGWRGYVCGDPALVQLLRKRLFLAGMGMRDIYGDAFLPST